MRQSIGFTILSAWLKRLIGINCVLCHEKAGPLGLCSSCFIKLPILPCVCFVCAVSLPVAGICGRCQTKQLALDALFVSYCFSEPLNHLIYAYKYQSQLQLAGVLRRLLVSQTPHFDLDVVDFVLPVPLSTKRMLARGFNQSQELAKAVSTKINKPLIPMSVCYREERPAQAGLKLKARQENIKGIFKINISLNNKNILLIDDVITTGATLNELAKSLKKQGARTVFAWVLAKKI